MSFLRLVATLSNWILFLREQLNASLPGAQSQSQKAPDSPRSDNQSFLGPISDGHPYPSTHAGFPMDIQTMQPSSAPRLKHNQHVLDFRSHSGTERSAYLQLSQILPIHSSDTNESRLHPHNSNTSHNQSHPVPIGSNRPRSLSTTALPPYIPDGYPSYYTTNALRRTSFSNLHARGSHDRHDGHQDTGLECSSSLSTPTGSSFSIGGSTTKYPDTNMDFDGEASSHHLHQRSSFAMQKPPLDIYDKGYNRYSISLSFSGQFDQMPSCDGSTGWIGNTCQLLLWDQRDQPCTRGGLLRLLLNLIHTSTIPIYVMMVIKITLILKVSTTSLIIFSFFCLGCMEPLAQNFLAITNMYITTQRQLAKPDVTYNSCGRYYVLSKNTSCT